MDNSATLTLHTGRQMPILGLGTWQLTNDTAGTVEQALRMGYRMIDTSGDYGTQPGVGEGIRRSGLERNQAYLVTKVEEHDDAYAATLANLRELGLDYADLMLIHRPPPAGAGVELWEGLLRAREEGLTRDIGVSNYTVGQMDELEQATGERPTVNQIEWTPFGWSPRMLEACRERGIVIQAYSPLTRAKRLNHEVLRELAGDLGRTPAQLLLRWNYELGVAPLPKANRREHLEENLGAFDFELTEAHMASLNELNEQWSALASLAYL